MLYTREFKDELHLANVTALHDHINMSMRQPNKHVYSIYFWHVYINKVHNRLNAGERHNGL